MLPVQRLTVVPEADRSDFALVTADPLFASDPALRIVLWNEGAEALLGFGAPEVLGTRCDELLGCRDASGTPPCRRACTAAGRDRPPPPFELEVRRKGGEALEVAVCTLAAAPHGGAPILVHLLRDLRRQRAIEGLLRQVVAGAARLSLGPVDRPLTRGPAAASSAVVTAREREVIRLLAQGASTKVVAAKLSITHRTARNHIQNLLGRLGAHSRLEAVARARATGLI